MKSAARWQRSGPAFGNALERHGSAALLSVVGAAGSVPRESGARIVLQPDGGFFGSIGGRLEYEAIAAVRAALAAGRGCISSSR